MSDVSKAWLLRGAGFLGVLFVLLQVSAMFFHVGDGYMRGFSRIVFPPAWVNFSPVSYHRVVETAHAFVALDVAPSYHEAFPLALGFALRDVRLDALLVESDPFFEGVFTSSDISALEQAGISSREQERYLVRPLLRFRSAHVLRNTPLPSQDMRLQNVLEKIDLGMPFADIARYFSEDSSAMHGGDLGVFLVSELPSWAQTVADMEIGEVRSDFVGADAFWVLTVVDAGGEGEDAYVRIRGIAINKPTLGAVLRAHAAEHPSWVFVW